MARARPYRRDRLAGAVTAAASVAALLYVLISGLAVQRPARADEALQLFGVLPPPPPPPERIEPRRIYSPRPEGAASPPNLRSKATPVVAPPPVIPPPPPSPVLAAKSPGVGAASYSGAADVPGPGTGAGGDGNGTGSGGAGDGDGDGGDVPPRYLRGRIKDSDYPRWAWEAGIGGTVEVRYVVEVSGRVGACRISRSSGTPELDALTCRLIRERFRFRPAYDAQGEPFAATLIENHSWIVRDEVERP